MNTSIPLRVKLFILMIVIVLPLSFILFKTLHSLPSYDPRGNGVITNPWVLQDQLPQSIIDVVAKEVQNYANQNSGYNSYLVPNAVQVVDGKYVFALVPDPGSGGSLKVALSITDSMGTTAVQTYINGQLQPAPGESGS